VTSNQYATVAALADRWGLTRQRVFQLTQMDGFPRPQKNVAGVNVYDVAKADAFNQNRMEGRHA
jgi:hypothetical protein